MPRVLGRERRAGALAGQRQYAAERREAGGDDRQPAREAARGVRACHQINTSGTSSSRPVLRVAAASAAVAANAQRSAREETAPTDTSKNSASL